MTLANMIALNESALECDLAETYHILEYRELPAYKVALFSVGLRDDSRIKMQICEEKFSLTHRLLACAIDRLSYILWTKTKDAEKGRNKPDSIYERMTESGKKEDLESFNTPEEFEQAMWEIENGNRNS